MTTATKAALAGGTALILPIVFIAAITSAVMSGLSNGGATTTSCTITGAPVPGFSGYSGEQITNAATIIAVGKQMHVPQQGWVVAIATALQESTLRNLDHGDRDSIGLFQQRPSQGWGTPTQLHNPTYAATAFYRHLLIVPDWQHMNLTQAAQTVQRSGTPNAYAHHEPAARALTVTVSGATCTPPVAPNAAAARAITFAHAQTGLPYVWGGNGPADGGGFDCSGLTTAAYGSVGISLPRTANGQYHATTHVTEAQLQPGDLVFYGNPHTIIHHVGLYIGNGHMIDAPTFGKPVGIHPIHQGATDDFVGGGRISGRN